jgi:hypothetical protein
MKVTRGDSASVGRPTLGQVVLGLLIAWQLVFMLGASFLSFWSSCHPDLNPGMATAAEATDHWAALTGQWQGWSLYGPNVPTQSAFIGVELHWDNEKVLLGSATEPSDVRNYFRPFGSSRLAIYESSLGLVLWGWDADAATQEPAVWSQRLTDHVRQEWRPIHAYLRWRLEGFQRDHPDTALPTHVVLIGHIYRIPPPDQEPWSWSGPLELPLARWRPDTTCPANQLPIEPYNLLAQRFDPLPIQP